MTPYVRALRALTATVFQRVYRPIAWVIGGILCVLFILIIMLGIMLSPWWFLLLIILIPATLLALVVLFVVHFLTKRLLPRTLLDTERQQIVAFSDKILRIAEVRSLSVPIIAFLIAKDVIRGKKSTFIESIVNDSTSLKQDFLAIRDMFA